MILIADGGSTKTSWSLVKDKSTVTQFKTEGYNPYFWTTNGIDDSLKQQLMHLLDPADISEIFFYGAGCSTEEKKEIVRLAIQRNFKAAKVFVSHDLLAAARALLKKEKGFAAILGTGTNTCLYDGTRIIKNIDSLGYMLGDEGSGSYIGRKVVRDFMRGYLPQTLSIAFREKYGFRDNEQIFSELYSKPYPNRTLASFCAFASENASYDYIQNIVRESFNDFFRNLVSRYPGYQQYTFNCIGSVGHGFRDLLKDISENKYMMKTGLIERSPMVELVDYHLNH